MSVAGVIPVPGGRAAWLLHAFTWPRLAAAAATALMLSLGTLVTPGLLGFLSPAQLAFAWLEHLAELAVLSGGLLLAYVLLDHALPRQAPMRMLALGSLLFLAAIGLAVLMHGYYAGGFRHLPPMLRLLSDAFHWGMPAVLLAVTEDLHLRSLAADSSATTAERGGAQDHQAQAEQQLALLQAQIEPHFLFNMLGNLRRLYRTQPGRGAEAMDSLIRYLRSAMPQLRNVHGTLADEIGRVRDYLELQRIRMGARLTVDVQADPAVLALAFPPLVAVTLVENAIRHGVEPAGGGHVVVRASRSGDMLEVEVADDGVGFGGAPSSGTGVGLSNVRRQLAARHGGAARLVLTSVQPRGARVRIELPIAGTRPVPGLVSPVVSA